MSEYWNKWWGLRSSRRSFLRATAGAGAGAAGLALVGCGDDDDDDGGSPSATSALAPTNTPQADATATPTPAITPGGEWTWTDTGDPASLNPYGSTSYSAKVPAAFSYSRLFTLGTGPGLTPSEIVPVPDLVSDYEFVEDTVLTMKLREDVTFHDIAPVNGRNMTTDDIKFSWELATADDNPNNSRFSAVDNIEFPDDHTIKFNLKVPEAEMLDLLADANLLWILPTEADGGFDPATDVIGSGPWVFDKYEPSVQLSYVRNPSWHAGENGMYPILDRVTMKVIPEPANAVAQFIAGNLTHYYAQNLDLPPIIDEVPDVQLSGLQAIIISFLYWSNVSDTSTPWSNPLVRQAISMAIDRDSEFDLYYNATELATQGIDMPLEYNNIIPAGLKRYWLDPSSAEHGDSSQYFKYDPAGAKAALSAAGFDNPADLKFKYQYTNRYGAAWVSVCEAIGLWLTDIGVDQTSEIQDYNAEYFPNTFAGNFEGLAYGLETPFPTAGGYPQRMFTDNTNNHSRVVDDEMAMLTQKQQQELNDEARIDIFHDIQRKNAEKGYYFPGQVGVGKRFNVYQPNANFGDRRTQYNSYGDGTEEFPYWWIDTRA